MAFWTGVLQDIVANLAAALVLGLGVALGAIAGFSATPRRMRRRLFPRRPDRRVLAVRRLPDAPLRRRSRSPFRSPVSPHEREALGRLYGAINGSHPFDGRCVRLDRIEPDMEVSEVGFFDLLATNFTAYPENIELPGLWRRLFVCRQWAALLPVIQKVRQAARVGSGRPQTVQEALANPAMANAAAVSVLVVDARDRAGVVRRSRQLAVSSGLFGATAAGTVAVRDLDAADPFLAAARRELREETGIDADTLRFEALVLPLQKMQPVFLYTLRLAQPWEAVVPLVEQAADFHREAERLYGLALDDPGALAEFLAGADVTDAAAYHLWAVGGRLVGEAALAAAWGKARLRLLCVDVERHLDPLLP